MPNHRRRRRSPRRPPHREVEVIPNDPPPRDAKPWNAVVLALRGVSAAPGTWTDISVKGLTAALKGQLGVEPSGTGASFEFRFHWLQVWLYPTSGSATSTTNLGVLFYSLQDAKVTSQSVASRTLKEDVGTPVRPASVKHVWRGADRTTVFDSVKNENIWLAAIDTASESLPLFYQVGLVWRSTGGDPVPTFSWSQATDLPVGPPVGVVEL